MTTNPAKRTVSKTSRSQPTPPPVVLVGAGPGQPGLITWRGLEALGQAEVVVFDALANAKLLDQISANAELIDAGKRPGRHKLTQDQINWLLVERAQSGKRVVRLKGGDPYLFGRGAEEVRFLAEQGVGSEVVPGVTAGIAAPMYAGIPVTHRGVASSVTFVTGHEDPTKPDSAVDYAALAGLIQRGNTVCFYMGVGRLGAICESLKTSGAASTSPAAAIQAGTQPIQRTVRGTLEDLPAKVIHAQLTAPAIIVVGQVAGLSIPGLNFFENRPLFGQTVLVTRTRQQASGLRTQLARLGARVIEAPTLELLPPEDWSEVDRAVSHAPDYDWLVLTSTNAVQTLAQRLDGLELDSRHLAGMRIACVGQATRQMLFDRLHVRAELTPEPWAKSTGEMLGRTLIENHSVEGKSILLLRADVARPALAQMLREAGVNLTEVTAYHSRPVQALPEEALEALRNRQVDWATFTSSSSAGNLVTLLGVERHLLDHVRHASIGQLTTQTLSDLGLPVTTEADSSSIEALVRAVAREA